MASFRNFCSSCLWLWRALSVRRARREIALAPGQGFAGAFEAVTHQAHLDVGEAGAVPLGVGYAFDDALFDGALRLKPGGVGVVEAGSGLVFGGAEARFFRAREERHMGDGIPAGPSSGSTWAATPATG